MEVFLQTWPPSDTPVSCHSSFCVWHLCLTSSGAPSEAGWWAHSCWIYGTNAAPLPTFLTGRGSMIISSWVNIVTGSVYQTSAGAVEGSGSSPPGSASLLVSRAKAVGFLLHIHTFSISCPVFSQPAEVREQRTDPRPPQVYSTLSNEQGFCQAQSPIMKLIV